MTGARLSHTGVRDAAVTVAPTLVVLLMSASTLAARHADVRRWMLAVLLAQALPLLVVRRFPRAVLAWTAAVTSVAVAVGLPGSNGSVAQAIAVAFVVARTGWPASAAVPVAVLAANLAGAWAARPGDLPREIVLTATSLALGWIVGDAVRRRAAVQAAMEAELVRRARHHRLQAEVGALTERLTIARELHGIVGDGLDAIIVQAGAARARVGTPDALTMITAIEAVARDLLAELDRFLTLLRLDVPERDVDRTASAAPVLVPEGRRFTWLEARAPALTLVGTAAVVSVLTYMDVAEVPRSHPVPWWWPVGFSAAVGAVLTARRRWPEATLVVLTVLVAAHHAAGIEVYNGVVAIPLAAYALMAQRSRRRGMVLATVACAAATVATAVGAPGATVEVGSVLTMLTAVALYVGDTARVARVHNATLAGRLADAEAEGALRRHAAVVAERTAAARDLHDSVGHDLSLVIIQAGAARLGAGSASPGAIERAAGALAAIEETARASLAAIETALHTTERTGPVVPEAVDIGTLVGAVRATGATVHVDAAGTEDLPRSLQSTVFRLVQEALTNAMKHAPGADTSVVVDRRDGLVRVRVANSRARGRGPAVPSGGRGLTGMRERVALFGGHLDVGPAPDGGYVVDASICVPATVDGAEAARQEAEAARQEVGGSP
jgi:signal transduction histidine kinase